MAGTQRNGTVYQWGCGIALALLLALLSATGGERMASDKAEEAAKAVIAHELSPESHPAIVLPILAKHDALTDDIDKLGTTMTMGFNAMNRRLDSLFHEVRKP